MKTVNKNIRLARSRTLHNANIVITLRLIFSCDNLVTNKASYMFNIATKQSAVTVKKPFVVVSPI